MRVSEARREVKPPGVTAAGFGYQRPVISPAERLRRLKLARVNLIRLRAFALRQDGILR